MSKSKLAMISAFGVSNRSMVEGRRRSGRRRLHMIGKMYFPSFEKGINIKSFVKLIRLYEKPSSLEYYSIKATNVIVFVKYKRITK